MGMGILATLEMTISMPLRYSFEGQIVLVVALEVEIAAAVAAVLLLVWLHLQHLRRQI
jgi:hypothetical protein